MPTKTEYTIEKELTEVFEVVMALEDFNHLREEEIKVLPSFCVRVDADGENVEYKWPPVKLKKVDDLHRLYMKDKPHYLLVMDYTYWKEAQAEQQEAVIHEALCSIDAMRNDAGDLKLKSLPPDVVTRAKTLKRYGPYRATLRDVADFFAVRQAMRRNPARLLPRSEPEPPEPTAEEEEVAPPPVERKSAGSKTVPPRRGRLTEPVPDEEIEPGE